MNGSRWAAAPTRRSASATSRPRSNLPRIEGAAILGRDAACDIVLDSPSVSRQHAVIRCNGDICQIADLGSTNGTFVNGTRIQTSALRDGDTIWIGGIQIYFDRSKLTRFSRGGGVKVDATDLSKVVGKGITILNGVSLSIHGELVCIVGGSGAGKTTLLDTLNGFRPATTGQVVVQQRRLLRAFDLFRQGLGYVPQDDIVHPELTVHQTLYYAARLRLPSDTSGAEIERLIEEVLESLELTQRRDTAVLKLSGGQRKRVSIGVELLTKPRHLLPGRADLGPRPGARRPDDGADAQAGRRRPHHHHDDPRHPQHHDGRQSRVHGARSATWPTSGAGRGADVLRGRRLHRDLQPPRSGGRPPGVRAEVPAERGVRTATSVSGSKRSHGSQRLVGAARCC